MPAEGGMRLYSHRMAARDKQLNAAITRVRAANDGVYGTRKVWLATATSCCGQRLGPGWPQRIAGFQA